MILYIAKFDSETYAVLDENGDKIGTLGRPDERYVYCFQEHGQATGRYLAKDLKASLAMLEPEAKWLEQITAFAEVQ